MPTQCDALGSFVRFSRNHELLGAMLLVRGAIIQNQTTAET